MTCAPSAAPTDPEPRTAFSRDGFIGPVRLLTPAQCRLALRHVRLQESPEPLGWDKGRAVSDRLLYDLATRPAILDLLRPLLGDDIVLWGVSIPERNPGQIHPWHTDIESAAPDLRFASVWIGLENTSRESALKVITRSHALGKTVQEVQHEHGRRRGESSDEVVLGWVRAHEQDAICVQPEMGDGEAIVFDGRLWHATNNERAEGRRAALLLQYASADSPVFMADLERLEWPTRLLTDPRPPCIVVSGSGRPSANRLVPAPATGSQQTITAEASSLRLPLPSKPGTPWEPHSLFNGPTPIVQWMGCHASVLAPGHSPHPPHAHDEEEILVALDGEPELVIADGPDSERARVERLEPGDFVYYPALQHHTIRNPGLHPVTYLMLRWRGAPIETTAPGESAVYRVGGPEGSPHPRAFRPRLLIEHPTNYLTRLHGHLTDLQPGAGYEPHADGHDVAIVLLSGRIETLGRTIEPFDVVFCAAGTEHGLRNAGDEPARYLVFEFHAPGRMPIPGTAATPESADRGPSALGRLRGRLLGARA